MVSTCLHVRTVAKTTLWSRVRNTNVSSCLKCAIIGNFWIQDKKKTHLQLSLLAPVEIHLRRLGAKAKTGDKKG